MNPLYVQLGSDSPRDNQIDYLPSDFPFALYQPPPLPSPKRQRVLLPPFPYFDMDSPTFGLATCPLLMDGPSSSTVISIVSFTANNLSPDTIGTLTPSTIGVTPPPHTRNPNLSFGATPTVSFIRAMVSTMLGTPSSFDGASTSSTVGASHSSNVGATYTSTINPSIPHTMGEQSGIGTWSIFSSQSSLLQPIPFLGTFSMWSMPHIGSSPLNQQSNPAQNPITRSHFAPGSLGMFHLGSGVSPPFPCGNTNPNLNPGSSIGFLFGWNLNSTTRHGQRNVGLAYAGSSSHALGNNPSLGNARGTPPLGQQSSGNQGISTPQHDCKKIMFTITSTIHLN